MKKLHEIVKEKDGKQNELSELIKNFEKAKSNLQRQIEGLKELEKLAVENKDIEKIQIARGIYDSIYMEVVELVEKDNILYSETAKKLKENYCIIRR